MFTNDTAGPGLPTHALPPATLEQFTGGPMLHIRATYPPVDGQPMSVDVDVDQSAGQMPVWDIERLVAALMRGPAGQVATSTESAACAGAGLAPGAGGRTSVGGES